MLTSNGNKNNMAWRKFLTNASKFIFNLENTHFFTNILFIKEINYNNKNIFNFFFINVFKDFTECNFVLNR